ncbi:MAG: FecR family protein, partial [Burkholderiales bacterium]
MALGLALVCLAARGQASESHTAAAPRLAGTVEFASGDSMITPQVGDSRLVAKGSEVHESDTIVTFNGGEAQLHMLDGAYLMVRENSRIKIDAYVADGGDKDRSILDLIKGAVRSITGWIGKYNRAAYEIRTPILVTIGVRGTDHEVTYIPPGDPRGAPGVYDKVNEGMAFMRSGSAVVEVPPQRAVFSAWGAIPHPPRLLASIPRFFKPGPHEREFALRARASVRTIAAQRQARIRAVRKLRGIGPRGAAPERQRQLRPGA